MQAESINKQGVTTLPTDVEGRRTTALSRTALLGGFEPINLEQMTSVALMDRVDTKYVMAADQLDELLWAVQGSYRVLEVSGLRQSHYETLYYDTKDLDFFASHHAGRSERFKVRRRSYVDSNLCFLEVKRKTNKGRTVKNRIGTERGPQNLRTAEQRFVESTMHSMPPCLRPVLKNAFTRITMVSRTAPERVTVDTGLSFWFDEAAAPLEGLVIVEVKQQQIDRQSPIVRQLRALGVRHTAISKYCVGMSTLYPHLKHNRFKPILRRIDQIREGKHHDE